MRFSQRIGAKPPFTSGLSEATEELRNSTWNLFHPILFPTGQQRHSGIYENYGTAIWDHLHWPTDELPFYSRDGRDELKTVWLKNDWLFFFDLFDFCVTLIAAQLKKQYRATQPWFDQVNELLKQKGCAYSFIAGELAPVTNATEMAEVEAATECAVAPAAEHIRQALACMPPSANSDLRNSIKESISAVESVLKYFTESTLTLGKGLVAFERKYGKLQPSIRRGLEGLYDYTNGPEGIRHGLVDGAADVAVHDARLMLVTCSAFVNYLIALASAAPSKGETGSSTRS